MVYPELLGLVPFTVVATNGYIQGVAYLFASSTRRIRRRNMTAFRDQGIHGMRIFFKIAFPSFILAALIETFLTVSMEGGIHR